MGKKLRITNYKYFSGFIFSFVMFSFTSCQGVYKIDNEIEAELNYIPYYLDIYKVDSLYKAKKYEESYSILDDLFIKYKPLNQDVYNEYSTYLKSAIISKQKIEYKEIIENLIKKFGYDKISFEGKYKDEFFAEAYSKAKVKDEEFDKWRNEYIASKNLTIRDSIVKMIERDQYFRNGENYKIQAKEIDSIANLNGQSLKYIFENFGFPNNNLIGNRVLRGKPERVVIDALLIHMVGGKYSDYFKDKVLKYVKTGACPPLYYALMIDRECLNLKIPQVYYTFSNSNEVLKGNYVVQVNKKRKEIGMPYLKLNIN